MKNLIVLQMLSLFYHRFARKRKQVNGTRNKSKEKLQSLYTQQDDLLKN